MYGVAVLMYGVADLLAVVQSRPEIRYGVRIGDQAIFLNTGKGWGPLAFFEVGFRDVLELYLDRKFGICLNAA